MGWGKRFGKAVGKMVEPVPVVSGIAEAVGEMGEDFPVRPVADYHRGLKEGASAAGLRAAEERERRERRAVREAQEQTDRAGEALNRAVKEAADTRREREDWERRAAALDAEPAAAAVRRVAETE